MRGLLLLILGVMVVSVGGCSVHAIREQIDKIIYKAPNVEIQTVPEDPGETKVICGQRVITRDKNGNIVRVEPLKN